MNSTYVDAFDEWVSMPTLLHVIRDEDLIHGTRTGRCTS